jgi:hypothetical protein
MNIEKYSYMDGIVEAIKSIDTDELTDYLDNTPLSTVIEEQRVYFWIRLYLKEETDNINIGDDIIIKWKPSGEELETKFIAYGKKGLDRNYAGEVTQYVSEDDKRVLSLMIDTKMVNFNNEIPFIRTLFKTGYHYDYQLLKRTDLVFINKRNNIELEYYDCDF